MCGKDKVKFFSLSRYVLLNPWTANKKGTFFWVRKMYFMYLSVKKRTCGQGLSKTT